MGFGVLHMGAWNGWYHLMSNTFGTWLPGDPRGFRTRKHREHVEGDYKNPPPAGKYDARYSRSIKRLKRPQVRLNVQSRIVAVEAIRHAMVDVHELDVLSIAVSSQHAHVLVRLPVSSKPVPLRHGLRETDPARFFMGIAKERSAKKLAAVGLVAPGGVWAKRGKIVPITERKHQVNVYRYILKHVKEGAVVWSFKNGMMMPE